MGNDRRDLVEALVIAWLALAFAITDLLIWVGVIVTVRTLIAQYKPALEPLLAMFAPLPEQASPSSQNMPNATTRKQ